MHTHYTRLIFLEDGQLPALWSEPPYTDEDGDPRDAEIIIAPVQDRRERLGIDRVQLSFTIDEADHFARRLWKLVEDARNGKFAPQSGADQLPPPPPLGR